MIRSFALCVILVGCGSVENTQVDGAVADAPPGEADAAPDGPLDLCPALQAPAGSLLLDETMCGLHLGFNPGADPTTNTELACPGTSTDPGDYGAIVQPAEAADADDCQPAWRLIAVDHPAGTPGQTLVQLSTTPLALAAGDRLRVRVTCTPGVASCQGRLQITGTDAAGDNMLIFPPGGGLELLAPGDVVVVDVAIPAALAAPDTGINFISLDNGGGVSDLLFGNPHIARE